MPPRRARHVAPPERRSEALTCFWLGTALANGRFMLVGELDLATVDCAREAIGRAQDETSALVCDLGDVWFVDFSGVCVLLDASARARRTGARLTLTNCPPIVPRMLEPLGRRQALDIQSQRRPVPPPATCARPGSPGMRMSSAELG